MRRGRGRPPKQIDSSTPSPGAPVKDSNTTGTTIIRGTSTRPLISFASDQPAVILEDVPAPAEPTRPIGTNSIIPEDQKSHRSIESDEGGIYCICKRIYDGRTMIACDRCDNWFHNDCVGIGEESLELVDLFICPSCQALTQRITTWKKGCARPGCNLASRELSKYCSDWCGMECVANRLESVQADSLNFWDAVRGIRKPEEVTITQHLPPEGGYQSERSTSLAAELILGPLTKQLEELIDKRFEVDSQLQLVINRLKYLTVAISRWENMCLKTANALETLDITQGDEPGTASATTKTKKVSLKGKGKGKIAGSKLGNQLSSVTNSSEAPCGFDVRLIWDDKDWAQWVSSEQFEALCSSVDNADSLDSPRDSVKPEEAVTTLSIDRGIEEGAICLIMRKKCDRHAGWQKTRENDFQTELNTLHIILDKLSRNEKRLREEIEEQELLWNFRLSRAKNSIFPDLNNQNKYSNKVKSSKVKKTINNNNHSQDDIFDDFNFKKAKSKTKRGRKKKNKPNDE